MNDYLEHYNHNHDALGRFARSVGSASSTVGSKLKSRKKDTTRKYESSKRLASKKTKASKVESAKKQKGSKSNNTKLSDSERKRLIESASLKEVTANKDKLSNRELESAIDRLQKEKINRIDLEKKLYDLNKPDNQKNRESAMQKIERLGENAETLATAINSGTKLYNNAVQVYNLGKPEGRRLPRIGNKDDSNRIRPWVQEIIDSGNAVKAAKYANQMTAEERSKVATSIKVMQGIKSTVRTAASNNSNNSSSNNSSDKKNDSSKKASNPSIESYDNEQDYERAVRTNDNYSKGGWKTYDSKGNEWTTYDYNSSNDSKSSSKQNNQKIESWADVRSVVKESSNKKSEDKAANIMENYPDYYDDWKKRKNRY